MPGTQIVARLLARPAAKPGPAAAGAGAATGQRRLIRLVDASTVRKADKSARESGRLWRIHAVFDLPSEQFSAFELTDEKEAERINRIAVIRHGAAMLRMDARSVLPTGSTVAPTTSPT